MTELGSEVYDGEFENYRTYRREDGILTAVFTTDGGPLMWTGAAHAEAERLLQRINLDADNKLVIITGRGDYFIGPEGERGPELDAETWGEIIWAVRRLMV